MWGVEERREDKVISIVERLDKYTLKTERGCWWWFGNIWKDNGYGRLTVNGKSVGAHRLSYESRVGSIPKGKLVCHKCDNPICVNPEHLIVGTHKDNTQDILKRGRWGRGFIRPNQRGEKRRNAKLNEQSVLKIRSLFDSGTTMANLARIFEVDRKTIWWIVNRKRWVHV